MEKLEENFNKLESLEKFQLKNEKMYKTKAGNTIADLSDREQPIKDTCECQSGNCVMDYYNGQITYVSGNWIED